jgi:hypothetical protein
MPSQLTPTKIQVTCRANTYRHTGARNHLSWCAVRGCCEYLVLLARQKGGRSRSHDAMIRVYDEAGNMIETHKYNGAFKQRR